MTWSETPDAPTVTICIPAHDDPTGIARCLANIATIDYPAERRHVIVAIDGPDPATEAAARRGGATVVVLPTKAGSYAARNAAIAQLPPATDIVVFTDADCIPTAGWLKGHVEALRDVEMSGGAITVTLRPRPSPAEFVDRLRHLHQELYVARDGYAATANLGVRRQVVDAMTFDARLQTGGDVEFCHRATAAGFRLAYSPAAEVEHPARETTRELMKKVRRIISGVHARPERWHEREIARPRPRRALIRIAHEEGISGGPLWDAQAVLLEFIAAFALYRTVRRIQRKGLTEPGGPQ